MPPEDAQTRRLLHRQSPRIRPQCSPTWARAVSRVTNGGRPSWVGTARMVTMASTSAYTP